MPSAASSPLDSNGYGDPKRLHPCAFFIFLLFFLLIASVSASEDMERNGKGKDPDLICNNHQKTSSSKTVINYIDLHTCVFSQIYVLSIPSLLILVALSFYVLANTAQFHFTPVVSRMSELLNLSPSTGGVTLLALGNGAPDAFTSVAAVWAENSRLGLGAIVSAGLFVSAFVVGFVALASSPSNFKLNPINFLRDVCFYLLAVFLMFWTYLSGEVYAWQAIGLVCIYVFFVGVVFTMDRSKGKKGNNMVSLKLSRSCLDVSELGDDEEEQCDLVSSHEDNGHRHGRGIFGHSENLIESRHCDDVEQSGKLDVESGESCNVIKGNGVSSPLVSRGEGYYQDKEAKDLPRVFGTLVCSLFCCGQHKDSMSKCNQALKVQLLWQLPVEVVLRSTIPAVNPSQWNRVYASVNLVLCPLIFLYIISSAISPYKKMIFVVPGINFPLWSLILLQGTILGIVYFILTKEPPKEELPIVVATAFVMSVFWISFIAGELVGCLEALGVLLKLPPALLGLTVLAWGNSIGDLVADVAVARAGQPAMAMAGCFAGPMFNMLVGFGLALAVKTSRIYPSPYLLEYNPSIVVAFFFLFASLLGSLVVVTWNKFRVPRLWGFWLIGLYITFVLVSISNSS